MSAISENLSPCDLAAAEKAEAKAKAKEAEELRKAAKVADSAALSTWRRKANAAGSIMALSPKDREGYSRAIFAATSADIKRKAERGPLYGPGPARCASGTYANNFADRRRAMQGQIAAQFARDVQADKDRRLAKCDWQAEYDAAMAAKRKERAAYEFAMANLDKFTVCFIGEKAAPAPIVSPAPEPIAAPMAANATAKRQRKPRAAKSAPAAVIAAAQFRARHQARLASLGNFRHA